MAFSVTKFNNASNKFSYRLGNDASYKKLADLDTTATYSVRGLFVNSKSRYPHAVAVSDAFYIDLPSHMTETVKAMIDDPETVDAINKALVGVRVYTYTRDGRTLYSAKWVDADATGFTPFN